MTLNELMQLQRFETAGKVGMWECLPLRRQVDGDKPMERTNKNKSLEVGLCL